MSAKGFTLVELLISVSIILILSGVVIVRFSSFDSSTLLRSSAYEVATAIREAQVYAVSVLGAEPEFDYPFGVTFTSGARSFTLFEFLGTGTFPEYIPGDDANQTDIHTRFFERSIMIDDVCVVSGGGGCTSVTQLEVSFRRPEFTALFHAAGYDESENAAIDSAQIHLTSENGSNVWVVEIGLLGHISVYKQ